MAAMFVGVFTAFEIAGDFESGMGHRLMLAAPQRMAHRRGYLIFGIGRVLLAHGHSLGNRAGHGHGGAAAAPSTWPGWSHSPCS